MWETERDRERVIGGRKRERGRETNRQSEREVITQAGQHLIIITVVKSTVIPL